LQRSVYATLSSVETIGKVVIVVNYSSRASSARYVAAVTEQRRARQTWNYM
jgi:hypothetical protein